MRATSTTNSPLLKRLAVLLGAKVLALSANHYNSRVLSPPMLLRLPKTAAVAAMVSDPYGGEREGRVHLGAGVQLNRGRRLDVAYQGIEDPKHT